MAAIVTPVAEAAACSGGGISLFDFGSSKSSTISVTSFIQVLLVLYAEYSGRKIFAAIDRVGYFRKIGRGCYYLDPLADHNHCFFNLRSGYGRIPCKRLILFDNFQAFRMCNPFTCFVAGSASLVMQVDLIG